MVIRDMLADDMAPVQNIYLDARITTFNWMQPEQFKFDDLQKSIEGEWVFVAEIDGEIVGFCSVWLADNFIHNLFIAPHQQGNGIGKSLLNHAFSNRLNKPARLKCTVKNTKACSFYAANGWVVEQANVEGKADLYHLFVIT